MTVSLPPTWAKSKQVPTSTIVIKGQGGDVVATIQVTGEARVSSVVWPYTYQATDTS